MKIDHFQALEGFSILIDRQRQGNWNCLRTQSGWTESNGLNHAKSKGFRRFSSARRGKGEGKKWPWAKWLLQIHPVLWKKKIQRCTPWDGQARKVPPHASPSYQKKNTMEEINTGTKATRNYTYIFVKRERVYIPLVEELRITKHPSRSSCFSRFSALCRDMSPTYQLSHRKKTWKKVDPFKK